MGRKSGVAGNVLQALRRLTDQRRLQFAFHWTQFTESPVLSFVRESSLRPDDRLEI